jgi:hypothetical protein
LDVVGTAWVMGAIRGRGTGIRVGLVEAPIGGGTRSRGPLRVGVVWDAAGGLVQREAVGITLFVSV